MLWGDRSAAEGTQADRSALPSGYRDPKNQAMIGVGLSLPEVKYVEDTPGAGAAAVKETFGERSWQRDVSPAHRKIVKDFFDNE